MGGCSAINCSNHSRNGFRMIKFPTNRERREKWVENCGRKGWEPSPHAQICIVHFDEAQFEAKVKGKLRKNAIPLIFDEVSSTPKKKRGRPKRKPVSESDSESEDDIHFTDDQFETHREDGWKKLKPNAIPSHFPEPAPGHEKGKRKKRDKEQKEKVKKEKKEKKSRKRKQPIQVATRDDGPPKRKSALLAAPIIDIDSESSSDVSLKENTHKRRRKGRPKKIPADVIYAFSSEESEEEQEDKDRVIASLRSENESMQQEINEFEKHNKAMTRVIMELEKHNKAMAMKLQELDKDNKVMTKKLEDLEKTNEDLRSKLNCCFSEEQYARMEKLVSLGKIERYIPTVK